ATVRIELSLNGGATYLPVTSSVVASLGSYPTSGFLPATPHRGVRVTVNGSVPASSTSGVFTIVAPLITVTGPVAGTTAFAGTALPIAWTSNLPPATTIKIELSRGNGGTCTPLTPSAPTTGSFLWPVSGPDAAGARVRLTSNGSPVTSATSGTFATTTPSVTVTAPAAGATFFSGTPATVAWSTNLPGVATALIELSRDGGASFETLAAAAPNTGTFAWTGTGPDATALVRVTLNGPPVASGTSGAFAIVTPTVGVTAPAAGTMLFAGTPAIVAWSTTVPVATALIELSRDGGASFETLAAAAPNTGT